MSLPKVSVIVPCYNQAHFLGECLESVRQQLFKEWECIIVDDGSSDNTVEVATKFCQSDTRFRYVHQSNKGLSGARNTGIEHSRGAYLNFLDSDDALLPEMLLVLKERLDGDGNAMMAYCGYSGTKEALSQVVKKACTNFNSLEIDFFVLLSRGNALHVASALIKREAIDRIGNFDKALKSCEDWDLWLRLGRITNNVISISLYLTFYRMTATSMTRNVNTFYESGITVINRIGKEDPRVKNPMPKYESGWGGNHQVALREWHMKCIGLYLSQHKLAESNALLENLYKDNISLTVDNFISLWRNVLFGSVMMDQPSKAWKIYKPIFSTLLSDAEKLYNQKGLSQRVIKDLFLPMSCTSPFTVAMTILPLALTSPPASISAFFSASM